MVAAITGAAMLPGPVLAKPGVVVAVEEVTPGVLLLELGGVFGVSVLPDGALRSVWLWDVRWFGLTSVVAW